MVRSTVKKVMWAGRATVFMVGLSLILALVLGVALGAGPTGAQDCPPNEPGCLPPNSPPTVDEDRNSVVVVEGQTATNTGTYSDDDPFGTNDVTITASVGNVTKTGTSSGTWSWSLANAPLGRQQVTITATDSQGESRTTNFTLTVTLPNGKIAFSTRNISSDSRDIYTMNPDGSGPTNLTNNSAGEFDPAFSPDGSKIAFTSDQHGYTEIYVMNANGSNPTRLTNNGADDFSPAFSQDATKIAFVSERADAAGDTYVMNAAPEDATNQPQRLTNDQAFDHAPVFSPDGSKIAFTSDRDGCCHIYIMNADGSGVTRLTNNAAGSFFPVFSPDGTRIAFVRNSDIYVMNVAPESDTNQPLNLTNALGVDTAPSWSPDGTKIAFMSTRDRHQDGANRVPEIYVMNADGSNQTRLTFTSSRYELSPSWGGASDTAPPQTTIDSSPADRTNGTSATFEFTSSEPDSVFECSLDGGSFSFARCSSPRSYSNLTEGQHTFQVRATDVSGNTDPTPASRTWIVDTIAPNVTIDSGPSDAVNTASASFGFSSESGATFQCKLDGGVFDPCSSPKSYTGLANGSHTFEVKVTDAAGNTGAVASRTWTIDTVAPETTLDPSGPSGTVNTTSAAFAFSSAEANAAFECRLTRQGDTPGSFAACTSPNRQSNLADGSYTFEVRAKDAAGNTDQSPAGRTWTVDATAPETTIDIAPPPVTNSRQASFYFSSSEDNATYECSLDSGAWQACNSPKDYADLSDGEHAFSVRATDTVGNVDESPASHAWTVDTVAPSAPSITAPAYDNDGAFNVSGTAEPGARVELFEGAAEKGESTADASGSWSVRLTGVPEGSHAYTAKATDRAGNVSASSGERTVIVDKTAPTVGSVSPADEATRVRRNTNVTATFSETMDPKTLVTTPTDPANPNVGTSTTFTLVRAGTTTPLPATVTLSADGKTITLDPSIRLAKRKMYTARISGAKDLAGNLLPDKVWSFKTGRR
jgi:Tol biopolymer transport system component